MYVRTTVCRRHCYTPGHMAGINPSLEADSLAPFLVCVSDRLQGIPHHFYAASALVFLDGDLPAVNALRLVRVFKMVRLFRKLTSLRILINALASSVVPVLYSFSILVLVISVYAILATVSIYIL